MSKAKHVKLLIDRPCPENGYSPCGETKSINDERKVEIAYRCGRTASVTVNGLVEELNAEIAALRKQLADAEARCQECGQKKVDA